MADKLFPIEKKKDDLLEISIADIVSFVRRYFILMICVSFLFAVGGYLASYLSQKEYTSQTILLPEQGIANSGGFFASLSMGGLSAEKIGAVRTDLYPNVLESIPFALHMLKLPIVDQDGKKYLSLTKFLEKDRKEWFFTRWLRSEKSLEKKETIRLPNEDILALSTSEMGDARQVLRIVQTSIEPKTGVITIQAEMTDPVVAAIVVDEATKYLMNYVASYRTGKTEREVSFLSKRVVEAKQRQQKAEYALQSYRDRNRNAFLNTARIEEQRLQADYTLAQSIYSDLVIKLEQAKIKVQEEQPIFKVLEPAKIPLSTSKPRRLINAIIFAMFGASLTILYIFFVREKYHQRLGIM